MLKVLAVPAFDDNYLWLIHDGVHAVVVDPGDADVIFAALETHRLSLLAILLTHHHADHVGGVPSLLQGQQLPVYGPRNETIPGITDSLAEGDIVSIPELSLRFTVLDVPGHTSGHIAYVEHSQGWLFCGDTLFAGGCGRLFEGTPQQMAHSLDKIANLPDPTLVFGAHEYTLANWRFAQEVEPDNAILLERIERENAKRAAGLATVPSSIGLERVTNPFLRCGEPAILACLKAVKRLDSEDPLAVFTALRQWKNTYR
ncbi:hydroxyacylglutathione hydrolase [soil metagenome]